VGDSRILNEINELHKVMGWYALKPEYGGYRGPDGNRKINEIKEKIKELELELLTNKGGS